MHSSKISKYNKYIDKKVSSLLEGSRYEHLYVVIRSDNSRFRIDYF